MRFRIEYIFIIIISICFYNYVVKDEIKINKNKKFIENNLKEGSIILTKSGIVGEIIEIDKKECLIISGKNEKSSYLLIHKDFIEKIIA